MTTALDLITLALKTAGPVSAGQTASPEDVNDSLLVLNSMLSSFNQSRWLIYHLVDVAAASTGAQSYSVGPGGAFNVTRPDRLQSAYVRLLSNASISGSGPTDFPLSIMQTHEEYSSLALKQLKSFPSLVFYDPTPVMGTAYFWPIPNNTMELHMVVKETLQNFPTLTTVITLPPEYFEALYYNLVGRLQILYQLPVNPAVVSLARAALNTIQVANHRVGDLMMPSGLSRAGGGWQSHGTGGVVQGTFTLDEDLLG